MNNSKIIQTTEKHLPTVFFFLLLLYFARPFQPVDDFWWHLATGKWIFQHQALPGIDPFTFTSSPAEDPRKEFILKGYWLPQLFSYLLYHITGWTGLVMTKSLILTGMIFTLWRFLVFRGVSRITALLCTLPTLYIVIDFISLRPHILSFWFALLFFIFIDLGLEGLKEDSARQRYLYFLPILGCLWANSHPGYVIAQGMALIYCTIELYRYFRDKNPLPLKKLRKLLLVMGGAALATFLNPNHAKFWTLNLTGKGIDKSVLTIEEYLPVWKYASFTDNYLLLLVAILTAFTAILVLAKCRQQVKSEHWVLALIFIFAGFLSARFTPFFTLLIFAIISSYLSEIEARLSATFRKVVPVMLVVILPFIASYAYSESIINKGTISDSAPEKAVDFLSNNNLPQPIFNPYEWGGYISWKLFPDYRVFTDARTLEYPVYLDYQTALNKNPEKILSKYGVNTVIFYYRYKGFKPLSGLVYTLFIKPEWQIVYYDDIALVCVRKTNDINLPEIEKAKIINLMISDTAHASEIDPDDIFPHLLLGQLFHINKNSHLALQHFQTALKIDPANAFAANWVQFLRTKQ